MLVTLIKGGDPLEEWGGVKIFSETFINIPSDTLGTLKTFFPEMKPLRFAPEVKLHELPELVCNACNVVKLFHRKTLEEMLVLTHIYYSMRILGSDSPADGVYLLCDRCWHYLSMVSRAKAEGLDDEIPILKNLKEKGYI